MSNHTPLAAHGSFTLPSVKITSSNLELLDPEGGFLGDRASKRAFQAILEDWRERISRVDDDPLGETPTTELSKKRLDQLLIEGDPESAGIVHGAIEDFAQELAGVIRRFRRTEGWQDAERIAVGGGFRESRIGELAIGRALVLLKSEGIKIELVPIRHHPDEAGLIGGVHLMPSWILSGHDGLLAVDIGGTNIRAGVVRLDGETPGDATVWKSDLWRHADDSPDRASTVARLADMLTTLAAKAEKKPLKLAPIISIGCPGMIAPDGSIQRGGQNLPGGNWEENDFNLPAAIIEAIPEIGGEKTHVLMHNDAVIQGLSQLPFMQDVKYWGVLTIGTGLGNAAFTNMT